MARACEAFSRSARRGSNPHLSSRKPDKTHRRKRCVFYLRRRRPEGQSRNALPHSAVVTAKPRHGRQAVRGRRPWIACLLAIHRAEGCGRSRYLPLRRRPRRCKGPGLGPARRPHRMQRQLLQVRIGADPRPVTVRVCADSDRANRRLCHDVETRRDRQTRPHVSHTLDRKRINA